MENDSLLKSISEDLKVVLAKIESLDARQNKFDSRLEAIEVRMGSLDSRVEAIEVRLESLDSRVEKLESRSFDTRPMWERAFAELEEISKRLDGIDRRLSVLNDDVLSLRASHRRLEDRVASLEHVKA